MAACNFTTPLLGILCSGVSLLEGEGGKEKEGRERYEHPKMVVSSRMKKKVERGL